MADNWGEPIELLVVSKRESRNKPGAGWKIRVVQYVKDNKGVSTKLEGGEYFPDQESKQERFKCKGLTAKDLDGPIREKWPQIMALLRNPPPIPADYIAQHGAQASSATAMTNTDEVPF